MQGLLTDYSQSNDAQSKRVEAVSSDGPMITKKILSRQLVQNWKSERVSGGFTLVELMIVIAIIGVIATFAVPAFQGYVVTANSAKVNVHYEQAVNWSKGEMLRLRAQMSSGFDRAEVGASRDTAQKWLDALQAEVAGTDATSPEGSAAYSVNAETAGGDASILFVLAGGIATGDAVVTLTRPIYGEFTAVESTSVCWNPDDC